MSASGLLSRMPAPSGRGHAACHERLRRSVSGRPSGRQGHELPTCLRPMFPISFHWLSVASLVLGATCVAVVAADVVRHPQRMAVMNVVWPVCALFGGVLVLWAYFRYGRLSTQQAVAEARQQHRKQPAKEIGFAIAVAKGALHCGAGCMLGDLVAEWLAFLVPAVAVAFGWGTLFADKMVAVWVLDFLFAFSLGIVFQYFAIVPMRNLAPGPGIAAAIKADALSLVSWQVGMYGFMAFCQWLWFPLGFGSVAGIVPPEFFITIH